MSTTETIEREEPDVDFIGRAYTFEQVRDNYLHDSWYHIGKNGHMGWVKGTIDDFEYNDSGDEVRLAIELPWGERHTSKYHDLEGVMTGDVRSLTDAYGVNPQNFELLVGEDIWVRLRYIDVEDGQPSCGTQINYEAAASGPWYFWKQWAKWAALYTVATFAILFVIGVS